MTKNTNRIKKLLSRMGFHPSTKPPTPDVTDVPVAVVSDRPLGVTSAPMTPTMAVTSHMDLVEAKFAIGQIVKHKAFNFRGIIFDVDPEFSNTDEWYDAIPEDVRPHKDQPYYHLLAENEKTHYVAYVSEQNLRVDECHDPVNHPEANDVFGRTAEGGYEIHPALKN